MRCSAVRCGTDLARAPPRSPLARTGQLGATGKEEDGTDEQDRNRSEEHTSELQSRSDLVCRLLLEKKKTTYSSTFTPVLFSRQPIRPTLVLRSSSLLFAPFSPCTGMPVLILIVPVQATSSCSPISN